MPKIEVMKNKIKKSTNVGSRVHFFNEITYFHKNESKTLKCILIKKNTACACKKDQLWLNNMRSI